jgi:hypothetical protein
MRKTADGKKLLYVYGASGDQKWEREYPQCRSRSDLFRTLRGELGLPESTSTKDVVLTLMNKTWRGDRWVDDFAS